MYNFNIVIKFGKTSTKFLSYVSDWISGHVKIHQAVTNLTTLINQFVIDDLA